MTTTSRRRGLRLAVALVAGLAAGLGADGTAVPLGAQTVADEARFTLEIKGISAGALSFSGRQDGRSYAVAGRLESTGLVALLRTFRYDAKARGSLARGRYVPARYSETADTGRRQSESVMEYRGGVPQVKVYNPPRPPVPTEVDPATQGGTVDPLTAAYALLRDAEAGGECNRKLTLFDGKRRSEVSLGAPQARADGVVCSGEYRRLQGFTAKEMAEKVRFPFTLRYAPAEGGRMRVAEVTMDTLWGKARLVRD
jgi:hypothetical protein